MKQEIVLVRYRMSQSNLALVMATLAEFLCYHFFSYFKIILLSYQSLLSKNLILEQVNIPSKIWKVPEKLGFSIRQANFQPIKHQDGHISRNELAKMEIYFFGTKVLCAPPRHHWDCCGLQLAYQERKKHSGWRGVVYLTEILVSTPF